MTQVKVTATGEPDASQIMRAYDYDEPMLYASAKIVEEKIQKRLKINVDEALMAYCAYIVRGARKGMSDDDIRNGALRLLCSTDVMVGVPETLQVIQLELSMENKKRKIVLEGAMQTSSYIMSTS